MSSLKTASKENAKKIQEFCKEFGYDFKLGHAYELLAKLEGQKSWNVMSSANGSVSSKPLPRRCYNTSYHLKNEEGFYQLGLVTENDPGYLPFGFFNEHITEEEATRRIDELNLKEFNITKEEAHEILISSMFPPPKNFELFLRDVKLITFALNYMRIHIEDATRDSDELLDDEDIDRVLELVEWHV